MDYQPRVADAELRRRLTYAGAVVIEGPRACGKTETARRVARSAALLDVDTNVRQSIELDPSFALEGSVPRLIDEWQLEPSIWNHIRRAVDDRRAPGQFVLTGSSVPADDVNRHSGAGRFSVLRLRPMSLLESGFSSGAVSLAALLAGGDTKASKSDLTVRELADRIVVGGWPGLQQLAAQDASLALSDYLTQMALVDVSRVGDARRDPDRIMALFGSLARHVATESALKTLATDAGGAEGGLSRDTVSDYLDVLGRLMLVEDQPAWAPHLRSRATLRKSPKRHLADPSLAAAALAATPDRLMGDLNAFGQMFESLVVRDLRVYAQVNDGRVYHYRDSYGTEVDAIVQLRDGRWGAFEVKLGTGRIDEAAADDVPWLSPAARVEEARRQLMPKETFGDYATRWIDERRNSKGEPLRLLTQKDYRHILAAYLMPAFGKRPIDAIAAATRRPQWRISWRCAGVWRMTTASRSMPASPPRRPGPGPATGRWRISSPPRAICAIRSRTCSRSISTIARSRCPAASWQWPGGIWRPRDTSTATRTRL